jgi:MFS family permease
VALQGRLRQSWEAFGAAFRNPELRRLQLAGLGSTLSIWVYSIAIAVYAYRADGAKAVGIVLFARWSLAAVFAPWLAVFADRVSRRRVMLTVDAARAILVAGMTAVAAAGGPSLVTYVLAVLVSIASAAFAPAQAALLPSLARTPEELTASNLAQNTISSVGTFAGPALGGVALAFTGPWLVFALAGLGYVWSGACVLGLRPDPAPNPDTQESITAELVAGFGAVGRDRRLQVIVGLIGAQMFVVGALEVVIVVDSIRVLHAGNAGVGWLNTTLGAGGLLGGVAGVMLAARKRLAADFGLGFVVFGGGLALLAAFTSLGGALVLFAAMGVGGTLIDVAGITLMQRTAPPDVVGRVFGVLESLMLATTAAGALVMPWLIAPLGPRTAFVVVGALLPVAAILTWRALAAIDRGATIATEPLELLRAISIFAPLPEPVLRDVPRTATVRAVSDLKLFALERDDFIAAVTGHAPSREAADSVVAARLPAGAPV